MIGVGGFRFTFFFLFLFFKPEFAFVVFKVYIVVVHKAIVLRF